MTILVVATTNRGKLKEVRQLLPSHINIVPVDELGLDPPVEIGTTFLENATLKARFASRSGYPTIADDSGLVVDALKGMPGVRSSRFAGETATDQENNQLLIERLARFETGRRTARFKACVVLIDSAGNCFSSEGSIEGVIAVEPRGTNGFGYDPMFEIQEETTPEFNGRTMAELTAEEKSTISHRSRAIHNLLCQLKRHPRIAPELRPLIGHDIGDEYS